MAYPPSISLPLLEREKIQVEIQREGKTQLTIQFCMNIEYNSNFDQNIVLGLVKKVKVKKQQ